MSQPLCITATSTFHTVTVLRMSMTSFHAHCKSSNCSACYMPFLQVRLQALPEQGCLLVSHPLLYASHFNFFYQTVVVLCQHNLSSGSYGLVLNKLMSSNSREVLDDMSRLMDDTAAAGAAGGLNLARDLPVALQALMGKPLTSGLNPALQCIITQCQHSAAEDSSDLSIECLS